MQLFSGAPDATFVKWFRMSKCDFDWLVNTLSDYLQLDPLGRGEPLSVDMQVAASLYRLGRGCSYGTVGDVFGIGEATARKVTFRFVDAVLKEHLRHSI
ncbi:hypothetical protein HDU67_004804, partial [Dinochytrium kinnereticum]